MALIRRWRSFLVFGVICLVVFLHFKTPSSETPTKPVEGIPAAPPQNQPPGSDKAKFSWRDLPIQNKVSSYLPLPTGKPQKLPRVQFDFKSASASLSDAKIQQELRETRRREVKKTFQRCWKAYRERAWLKDELDPINGGSKDTFGGWAATLIDSLDTLWIMGLRDEFKEAVEAVKQVDFAESSAETINVFETTIRHLGGFLAAYDLSGEKILLDKALEVAEMLYKAFDTPNRMPVTRWKWIKAAEGVPQVAPNSMLIAELGSLTMEFTRLSQITGDPKFYDAVARVMDVLERNQNKTQIPGMWPISVDAENEDFMSDGAFTLAAMADSAYEYLPKMHALFGGADPRYETMYKVAMDTAIEKTMFRPMTPTNEDILISGFTRPAGAGVDIDPQLQHLVCFTGGMFALGGKLFQLKEHVDIGQKLTNACIWAYKSFPYGIMPEVSHVVKCESKTDCTWNEEKWNAEIMRRASIAPDDYDVESIIAQNRLPPGFSQIDDRRYVLRPEAIESVFIMYRITGEQSMQAAAWDMFNAINRYTATDLANAAISDVTVSDATAPKAASMESFWLAETLKYFYLIFSEPSLISLDEYVFNTEAHPFKRPV